MGTAKYSLSVLIFAWVACLATMAPAQGTPPAGASSGAEPVRPSPALRPEARPDRATAEAGKRTRIDVLANDEGVPDDPNAVPEMKIEGTGICGTAKIDGRFVVYQGGDECAGKQVEFDYSVFLKDEWVTGHVTVTVTARASACDIQGSPWRLIKIDGGHFDKQNAPPAIVDFTDLLNEQTFDVTPFCLLLEPIPSVDMDKYFASLPDDQRHEQFPEFFEAAPATFTSPGESVPATNVSFRMAQAYAKQKAAAFARDVTLPTLNELIAAAWELQVKRPAAAETNSFLISLRSGNLQWTSTPCSPAGGSSSGKFLTIGPTLAANGMLTKLCFEQSRRDHTGFRLVVR
jgi:hypothetical protein